MIALSVEKEEGGVKDGPRVLVDVDTFPEMETLGEQLAASSGPSVFLELCLVQVETTMTDRAPPSLGLHLVENQT